MNNQPTLLISQLSVVHFSGALFDRTSQKASTLAVCAAGAGEQPSGTLWAPHYTTENKRKQETFH